MPDRDGGLGTERAAVGAGGGPSEAGSREGERGRPAGLVTSVYDESVRLARAAPRALALCCHPEPGTQQAPGEASAGRDTGHKLCSGVQSKVWWPVSHQSSSASPPPPPAQPPTCQTQHGETGNFPSQPGTLARMGTPWSPGRHASAPCLCSPALTPPNHKRLSHSGPSAFGVSTSGACGIPPTFSATSSRPGWPTQCPAHVAAQGAEMLARGPTGPGRVGGPEAGSCRPPGEAGEAQPHPTRGQRPAAWHPARPHFSLRLRTQQDARFKQLPERARAGWTSRAAGGGGRGLWPRRAAGPKTAARSV